MTDETNGPSNSTGTAPAPAEPTGNLAADQDAAELGDDVDQADDVDQVDQADTRSDFQRAVDEFHEADDAVGHGVRHGNVRAALDAAHRVVDAAQAYLDDLATSIDDPAPAEPADVADAERPPSAGDVGPVEDAAPTPAEQLAQARDEYARADDEDAVRDDAGVRFAL